MAFYYPRVHRASPETIYLLVNNASANTYSVGHAAFWYNVFSASGGTNGTADLYQITFPGTSTVFYPRPGMFAGIVTGRDIEPGDYGSIQVWGRCDFVLVQGKTAAPFVTVANTDSTNWTNKVLRPLGIYAGGTTEGAATNVAYMGIVPVPTTSASWAENMMGGYLIPLDGMYTQASYPTIGTALVSISVDSVRATKAFIKCLH